VLPPLGVFGGMRVSDEQFAEQKIRIELEAGRGGAQRPRLHP
jgi:hypothetical protein